MERYMVVLRRYGPLSADLKNDLRTVVYPIRLKKGEIIHTLKDHVHGLYFVEKGLLQHFRMRGRKKQIFRFLAEDEFSIVVKAYDGTTNADFEIEALEDTILWNFPEDQMQPIFNKHLTFNRHWSLVVMMDLTVSAKAAQCCRKENDPANYYQLRQNFPHLLDRVPIPNLANFTWMSERKFRHLHQASDLPRL
jgi:signal-transduction protein with cAMP-binding, CBS, and nucleotidyltransferase domain